MKVLEWQCRGIYTAIYGGEKRFGGCDMSTLAIGNYNQVENYYYMGMQQQKKVQTAENPKDTIDINSTAAEDITKNYTFTMPDGKNISIYKEDMYTKDNPRWVVKATDKDGTITEQTVDVKNVDPLNCSFMEFSALNAWLLVDDEYHIFEFNIEELAYQTKDIFEKKDYLHQIRAWRDEQMRIGNMVGCNNSVRICSAISNYLIDQSGKTDYIDGKKAYLIDASVQSSGIGSCSALVDGEWADLSASYAEDSTAENPIVKVRLLNGKGSTVKEYRICVNEIDPENATQMEIFALLSHIDKQGKFRDSGYMYGESSYYKGFVKDLFRTKPLETFTTEKINWIGELEKITEESTKDLFTSENWSYELLSMLETFKEERIKALGDIVTAEEKDEVSQEALQKLFEEKE